MVAGSAPFPSKRDACPLPAPKPHRGPQAVLDWAKLVWCGMNESRSLGLAAQMAFWLFFSLLPLAAVGGLVLARIAVAALGTCVVLSLGIAVIAVLCTGLGWLFHLAGTNLPHSVMSRQGSWLIAAVKVGFGALIAFGLIVGLYTAGTPHVHDRHPAVVPGALLAVSLQALSGFGYSLYVRLVGTGNAYQAGLGIVGVTMMSLYLFCLALLVGAELNQAVSDRRASADGPRLPGARHQARRTGTSLASGVVEVDR